jgi:hypothetical protein
MTERFGRKVARSNRQEIAIMLTKVAFGVAIILSTASVSLAATHVQPSNGGQTIYNPAPTVTYPVENCSTRVTFPSCSEGL